MTLLPLLKDKQGFRHTIDLFANRFPGPADRLRGGHRGARLHVRRAACLRDRRRFRPRPQARQTAALSTLSEDYALEYGTNSLEIHADALAKHDRVVVVDDLLATGGTAAATRKLLERLGADVVSLALLVELTALKGRDRLPNLDVVSFVTY